MCNYIREVSLRALNEAPPMGGLGSICTIDESLLRGRRKYNRERLLRGNRIPLARNNYGRVVTGPWIFGMVCRLPDGTHDLQMFHVLRRNEATIRAKILRYVAPGIYRSNGGLKSIPILGTLVISDQWAAYRNLRNWGNAGRYYHETVNHDQGFINPITSYHTQAIETHWGHVKTKILRPMRGTNEHLIRGHLSEYWWKKLHHATPFWDIITEISRQFPLVQ